MKERPAHDVTVLLTRVSAGDESAPGKLLELVSSRLVPPRWAYMQDERGALPGNYLRDKTRGPIERVVHMFIAGVGCVIGRGTPGFR